MKRYHISTFIAFLFVVGLGVPQYSAAQNSNTSENQQKDSEKPERWDEWRPAVLQIVTNFDKANVTVNGLPYLAYEKKTETKGMVLPAGGPHQVKAKYGEKTKIYNIHLEPEKKRVLMIDLSGFEGETPRSGRTSNQSGENTSSSSKEGIGRVTVYSKPKGTIVIDDKVKNEATPGTVEVEPGRHRISVRFTDGTRASTKTVRVREDSRIKLFFRQK